MGRYRQPTPRRPASHLPRGLGVFLIGGILLAGCSGDGAVRPSPQDVARQALAEYDANQDGALDSKELEQCPALRAALPRIDRDGDGRLSADEIAARLAFFEREATQTAVTVTVTLDGSPLAGATVTFVPEKFMGPSFPAASGVTNEAGVAALRHDGTADDALTPGYYRVEIRKKDTAGQELVPARYNAKSTLGREVGPCSEGRGGGGPVAFRLARP